MLMFFLRALLPFLALCESWEGAPTTLFIPFVRLLNSALVAVLAVALGSESNGRGRKFIP